MKNKLLKSYWILFVLIFQLVQINSQTISNSLISNSGGNYTSIYGDKIDWTLGDFMIEQIGENDIASQGFLQPEFWKITAIKTEKLLKIKIFPNPFADYFYIETTTNNTYNMSVLDINGSKVYSVDNLSGIQKISNLPLAPAIYFIILTNTKTKVKSTYKLINLK